MNDGEGILIVIGCAVAFFLYVWISNSGYNKGLIDGKNQGFDAANSKFKNETQKLNDEIDTLKKIISGEIQSYEKYISSMIEKYIQKNDELEYEFNIKKQKLDLDYNNFVKNDKKRFESFIDALDKRYLEVIERANSEIAIKRELVKKVSKDIPDFLSSQCYELIELQWDYTISFLKNKKRPAIATAARMESLLKQKYKKEENLRKQYEFRACFYEELFPALADYLELPVSEAIGISKNLSSSEDKINKYVAPTEKMSDQERYQLALDRYKKRSKSNWEIGREFERYVGYKYSSDGYDVIMQGAIKKLEDMGRDVIAKKNNVTQIIQCKYWAADKTIHEKHIFQLYGTTLLYALNERQRLGVSLFDKNDLIGENSSVIPVFAVMGATLSETALKVADVLGVKIDTNYNSKHLNAYPMIKCNKSSGIYHLPFDQQYDTTIINYDSGDFYAKTIIEAESAGFRRAWRWNGS